MTKNKRKLPDNQITVSQTPDGSINISLHLKNIYKEGELDEIATAEDFSVVQLEEGAGQCHLRAPPPGCEKQGGMNR